MPTSIRKRRRSSLRSTEGKGALVCCGWRAHLNPQGRQYQKDEEKRRDFLCGSAYHAVLAVKDESRDALAACGGLTILDGCARRDSRIAGNPAQDKSEDRVMNTVPTSVSLSSHANAFSRDIPMQVLRERVPACSRRVRSRA